MTSVARRPNVSSPVPNGSVVRMPCTPVNYVSPLSRRRRGITDKSPVILGSVGVMLEMNDDEAEKRERRRSKVLEMQQRNLVSPITPAERRQSLPLSGLTNAQLAEHYADCIKLSTENKISAKNAFGLHLIDYMSELFKKKEVTDFQLASSTLDASAKIYAGRVDAIHTEMYKVLSGLGRGASEKSPDDDADADANDDEKENDNGVVMAGDEKEKKRKRARKSNTVETNLKNITVSQFDLDFEMDPAFQKMPSATDEGGTGCLLLNHLRSYSDNSSLVLDFNTVTSSTDDDDHQKHGSERTAKSVDVRLLRDTVTAADFDSLQICPAFADFKFMDWNADSGAEDVMKAAFDKLGQNVHRFDIDAEPEPIPDLAAPENATVVDDIIDDGFGPVDDDCYEEDNGNKSMVDINKFALSSAALSLEGKGKEAELLETAIANIRNGTIGNLIQVLASEPSDYSYFKTDLMRTWAGPEHWKLQPKPKDSSTAAAMDKPKKSKVKEAFSVTFSEEVDLDWHFKVTKAATTVTKVTLEKHSKQQTTLPDDLHYDAKQLMKLFSMPSVMVKWQTRNTPVIEVDKYDYENSNDKCNFCPGSQDCDADAYDGGAGDDDVDDGNDDAAGGLDFNLTAGDAVSRTQFMSQTLDCTAAETTLFGGDNLLVVPRKIAKIDIDYAKVAKRIDVKRLKTSMWEVITEYTSPPLTSPSKPQTPNGHLSFQQLLNNLSDRIPKPMAKNLSVPIAFVCLLHLANDKTLKIGNSEEMMSDLVISLG